MKMNFIGIAGGALVIVSMFLPFFSILGISSNGLGMGGVAYFYMICGAAVAAISYLPKRWLNIVSIVLGLIIAMLAMKYQSDAKSLGAEVGIGLWLLLVGGLLSIVGGIMGVIKKPQPAVA
jgi:uncharacterized protein with PQ loop repeat